jgi:methanogenic corrinoid protein MtbC1
MTVYRYVRTGRIDAIQRSGVWLIDEADLRALAAAPPAARAGGVRTEGGRSRVNRFVRRLVAGDELGAFAVIEEALVAGADPDEIYLDLISPAMLAVGRAWECGELSVGDEHRSTFVAERMVGRMSPRFSRRGRRGPTFILAAVEGDRHGLPISLAADLCRSRGYNVVALGADTPATDVAAAARAAAVQPLGAVLIASTTSGSEAAISRTIELVRNAAPGVVIGLGGAAVSESAARELEADIWSGNDGRQLLRAAEAITPSGR